MSTAKSIADAFVTAISAIATPPGLTIHRKTNVSYKTDARPTCVVWIESEAPDLVTYTIGGTDRTIGKRYTIGVARYRVIEGTFQTNIDSNPTMTLAIKKALAGPTLTGVSAVWDMDAGSHSEWEKFGEGSETSKFMVDVRAVELTT
jgi:hypothetical protein